VNKAMTLTELADQIRELGRRLEQRGMTAQVKEMAGMLHFQVVAGGAAREAIDERKRDRAYEALVKAEMKKAKHLLSPMAKGAAFAGLPEQLDKLAEGLTCLVKPRSRWRRWLGW
jgi:hypothetical protein